MFHKLILALYLMLLPFYRFEEGQPQPSDYVLVLGMLGFLLNGKTNLLKRPAVVLLTLFLLCIIAVNFFQSAINDLSRSWQMNLHSLFYLFNFLTFLFVTNSLAKDYRGVSGTIGKFAFFSVCLQFMLGVLNIGTGKQIVDAVYERTVLFFNNPNQLGYYVLLMGSFFVFHSNPFSRSKLLVICFFFMSSYLILLSGSRASLAGLLVLLIIIFVKEGFRFNLSAFFFVLTTVAVITTTLLSSGFITDRVTASLHRNQTRPHPFIQERGYDRIIQYPAYLLFGAGEGRNDRFASKSFHTLEIHSGWATILFCYSIWGFVIFILFLRSITSNLSLPGMLVLLPAMIYNFSHQGLRQSSLWILLAGCFVQGEFSRTMRARAAALKKATETNPPGVLAENTTGRQQAIVSRL